MSLRCHLAPKDFDLDDKGPMKYGDPRSNPAPGTKADKMKKQLLKQDRVRIIIPKADGEDPKIRLSVNLNGYRLDLPKNTYLDLPDQIADVIIDSQKQQTEALIPFRVPANQNYLF